jgi:hypothetical protein
MRIREAQKHPDPDADPEYCVPVALTGYVLFNISWRHMRVCCAVLYICKQKYTGVIFLN